MEPIEQSCCFTGYRPEKFGFPLDDSNESYRTMVCRMISAISDRILAGCTVFYTGMACGFDIIAGEYVELVARRNKDIKLIAAVPYPGQENSWSDEWKERYHKLLESCSKVIYVSNHYDRGVFAKRNRYMVDRSRHVIAYYDGKPGGTGSTVKYAKDHMRHVVNIYETDTYNANTENYKPYLTIENAVEFNAGQ